MKKKITVTALLLLALIAVAPAQNALSLADIDLQAYRMPQRITDNFLKACFVWNGHYYDHTYIYLTELTFYVLGWSKDGKLAYLDEQTLESHIGSDWYFCIFDAVEDRNIVCEKYESYDYDAQKSTTLRSFVAKNARHFDSLLNIYGIQLRSPEYGAFPLEYQGEDVSVTITIKDVKNEGYTHQTTTYDIVAEKGGKHKILNTETDKNCWKVVPVGYVKSPFENRIAAIVIHSRYVFEDSEMFISLYGCSLDAGFSQSKKSRLIMRSSSVQSECIF